MKLWWMDGYFRKNIATIVYSSMYMHSSGEYLIQIKVNQQMQYRNRFTCARVRCVWELFSVICVLGLKSDSKST